MTAHHRRKGSSFERLIADHFKVHGFLFADRRVKTGAKDRGDIGGVHAHERPVTIECKNTTRIELGVWAAEAEVERVNDNGLAGVVIHKRHGKGKPGDQWVTLTVDDLLALLTGRRP